MLNQDSDISKHNTNDATRSASDTFEGKINSEAYKHLKSENHTDDSMSSSAAPDLDMDTDIETVKNIKPFEIGMDSGKKLLYPNVASNFPMKTSDRLVDDILCDIPYLFDFSNSNTDQKGLLKESPLLYSKKREDIYAYSFGTFIDQITLQTKYEYDSVSCPSLNKIQVLYGVLMNPSRQVQNLDDVIDSSLYHLKISVKKRSYLEQTKKQVGVTRYHLIDSLHPFDKPDFPLFDVSNKNLIEHAIYVSSDTNRVIVIELFNSEFLSEEEIKGFKTEDINLRYQNACKELVTLNPEEIITPSDCFNTLFKILKVPLNRKSSNEPIKTIREDNVALNSHINPNWLLSKYKFNLNKESNSDTNETLMEYEPPDLSNYVNDIEVRRLRDVYIKRCLELAFRGQLSLSLPSEDQMSSNPKTAQSLNSLDTQFSIHPLFQVFGDSNSNRILNTDSKSPFDINLHFVNLSASYYYSDRDIIKNYEIFCSLDSYNTGTYFDALSYIANVKGAYQLVAYCGKQNIVGKEALDTALRYFKIDPTTIDISEIDDKFLLSIYKHESRIANAKYFTELKNSMRVLAKYKQSRSLVFYVDHEPYKIISQAYGTLEIDESVDDDIVQTAYTVKINDAPGLKIDCDRALYTIAINKRSMTLFNFLLEQCPEFLDFYSSAKFSYQEALTHLQVNENANDELVINIFQQKWNEESITDPDQFLNLKAALTKIGTERNSKLIQHFLETETIDASCLPPENWPIGLNNIGNTCYLNSLIQYYFSITPLRNYILNYQSTFQDFEDKKSSLNVERRIGGREVSDNEVERSIQFVYQLRELFDRMIYSSSRFVTPSHELAYLAFAPSNVEVEFEVSDTKKIVDDPALTNGNVVVEQDTELSNINQASFQEQLASDAAQQADTDIEMVDDTGNEKDEKIFISTSSKVTKISSDQLENALEMGRQQDVTECIGNVLYQLESASEPIRYDDDHEQYDLVKQLFYGKTKQKIVPLNDSNKVRTKYEGFLSLLVNVSDHPKDIYDALDSSFQEEFLSMEEYGNVKRTVSITLLPTILQVQIQRVYYDRERFMPFKSIEPVPFGDTIYMDRYVDSTNPVLQLKKVEALKMKMQLKTLKERQRELLKRNELGLSRKEAFIETSKFLNTDIMEDQEVIIPNRDILVNQLNGLVKNIDKELTNIYTEINNLENKIDHQFDEFKEIGYTLFAVFIHRGEASYGHYWVYIKDLEQPNLWRKYNDETVTEVNEDEVFNFKDGNTATPYFLVFVKNEEKQSIGPLKRIIDTPLVENIN